MQVSFNTDLFLSYKEELDGCKNFQSVRSLIEKYKVVSPDLAAVKMETPEDFESFRGGLDADKQGNHPGEDWLRSYASIAIPLYILKAELLSKEFGVPWGVAYLQMCATGAVPGIDPEAAKQEVFLPIPQ
jgi:hypothetical protein